MNLQFTNERCYHIEALLPQSFYFIQAVISSRSIVCPVAQVIPSLKSLLPITQSPSDGGLLPISFEHAWIFACPTMLTSLCRDQVAVCRPTGAEIELRNESSRSDIIPHACIFSLYVFHWPQINCVQYQKICKTYPRFCPHSPPVPCFAL